MAIIVAAGEAQTHFSEAICVTSFAISIFKSTTADEQHSAQNEF